MGSTPEGSSSAAQGAQISDPETEPVPERSAGFFRRLFGTEQAEEKTPDTSNGARKPEFPAENPFNLRNPPVRDFAIPRAEIVAVPVETGLDELVAVFRDSGRTRLPVFEGTLDDPKGFVHLKDLALEHGFNGLTDKAFSLRNGTLHDLLYVADSMRAEDLLGLMRAKRIHMALVIDEYGGTDGLVTFEDLVEVIFGEISDEHDDDEDLQIREEGKGVWLCPARFPLEDIEEQFDCDLLDAEDDDEVDTLGGLVFLLAGRVPVAGEVIRHDSSGLEFEIVSADPRKIKEIRIRRSGAATPS